MRNTDHTKSIGLLVLAALCWSLGGLLIKSISWPPLAVAGGRGLIAAVFLAIAGPKLRFTWSRTQILGALAYAACTILFVIANKLTTAANAILLQYTAPIYIALLGAWFLGEPASKADWLTISAVLAGMALFFVDQLQLTGLLGNLIAIGSGVGFAAMTLLLRKQKDTSALESIILGNVIAGLIGLPFMLSAPLPNARGLGALALLGIVQLGISYLLYSKAIKHVTALEAVLIPVIEPILNPIWVLLLVGESPSRFALLGGLVVLGSITLRAVVSIRGPGPQPVPLPAQPGV